MGQQWKPKTPISWVLNHSVDKDKISLKMYEAGERIIDEVVHFENLHGGRLGVFCMSQELVTWSSMSVSCVADKDSLKRSGVGDYINDGSDKNAEEKGEDYSDQEETPKKRTSQKPSGDKKTTPHSKDSR